jgi:hypothetical protein
LAIAALDNLLSAKVVLRDEIKSSIWGAVCFGKASGGIAAFCAAMLDRAEHIQAGELAHRWQCS